jgi:hypothetical protein
MSHAAIIDADGVNAWYGSSHVLRGIDFASAPARRLACWAATAWARARCCGRCWATCANVKAGSAWWARYVAGAAA